MQISTFVLFKQAEKAMAMAHSLSHSSKISCVGSNSDLMSFWVSSERLWRVCTFAQA